MTQSQSEKLERLVAARLGGKTPNVPDSLKAEVERALAANAAPQGAIDETVIHSAEDGEERRPPALPDEYRIEREIGKGGMGVVYLAHQRSRNREVALKVLRADVWGVAETISGRIAAPGAIAASEHCVHS